MAGTPWVKIRKNAPESAPAQTNLVSSSDLFVCNTDALTAQTDPDDPNEIAQSGANSAVIPFNASGMPFVDLFLIAGNATTAPTTPVTTPCKVRAFGQIRSSSIPTHRKTPYTINTTVFDDITATVNTLGVIKGYWVPLYSAGGTHEQTFGSTPEVDSNSVATKKFQITGGISYFTRDTENILIVVSTALVQTNATAAMILASLGTN